MREQVLMVSPYFVPGAEGVESLRRLRGAWHPRARAHQLA